MLGALVGVPDQRPHFVSRPELRARVKAALLTGSRAAVGLSSPHQVGLFGQGGLGKTVTAIDVVHDEEVRRSFPDGIYWLTLGQTPNLVALQSSLVQHLAETEEVVSSISSGIDRLRELLADRACLIVLDDVWRLEHAEAFGAGGVNTRLVTTTRDASINYALGAELIELDLLDEENALNLLAAWSECATELLGSEARQIVERCGRLPLAIALAGALLRDGVGSGELLASLHDGNLRFLDHPYASVFATLRLSLDALSDLERCRFLELAVVPEDVAMPVTVIESLWAHTGGLTDIESRRLLVEFQRKSLLYLEVERGSAGVGFHDLQRDFLYLAAEDLTELHDRLLGAFEPLLKPSTRESHHAWWTLPTGESYLWHRLAHHLLRAGRLAELRALLLDYAWIAEKLQVSGVGLLLADYDFLPGDTVADRVQGALRLAANVLERSPDQLPSQLKSRLGGCDEPEIELLLAHAEQRVSHPWLRPVFPSLTPPKGFLIQTFEGHRGEVLSVAVTPDGERVVSGSSDHTLKVWNLASAGLLHTLEHGGGILSVAVTPDGERAVSGSFDHTVKVWDLRRGNLLHTLEGHESYITSVAVTLDGERVVSGSSDETLKVWHLSTGSLLHTLKGHTSGVNSIGLTLDGERVVSGSDHEIHTWKLNGGALLTTSQDQGGWLTCVGVTPDGKRVVSGSNNGILKTWDLMTGALVQTIEAHTKRVDSVAVTPDGQRAVSCSDDCTIRVWDLTTGALLNVFEGHENWALSVAITADGKRVVSGSSDGTVKAWNLGRSELNSSGSRSRWIASLAVTGNGERVISGWSDGVIEVSEVCSGVLLYTLKGHSDLVSGLAVMSDGRRLASGSRDRTLKVWDLTSTALLFTLPGHGEPITSVAVSPDGGRVVSGSKDQTLKVWDLTSGALLLTLSGHSKSVTSVAVTPDGEQVVSGSLDGTLKIWGLASGAPLLTITGHDGVISQVAVMPDGKRVICGTGNARIKMWDIADGALLYSLQGNGGWSSEVAVSPDGERLVASSGKRLEVRDLVSGKVIASFTSDAAVTACTATDRYCIAGDALGHLHVLEVVNI